MGSNNFKINNKRLFQIILFLFGVLIIFFTYFNKGKDEDLTKKDVQKELKEEIEIEDEKISTFENIEYDGIDTNGNKFIINSEHAEFTNDKPNLINMEQILCRFFFKDGTILKITSNRGVYNNISNDMQFEENVKMFYLENKIYSEKATFINSKNYLLVEDKVVGESPQGDLIADKLDFDLNEKKLKISMYDNSNVNLKVNIK